MLTFSHIQVFTCTQSIFLFKIEAFNSSLVFPKFGLPLNRKVDGKFECQIAFK